MAKLKNIETRPCWFVDAMYGSKDQYQRFIEKVIWQNGYQDKYLDLVNSIQVGDRIAIKSAYNRKNNLSFDNRGQPCFSYGHKSNRTC